ncbi:Ig-like domain-containing protein [Hymenobacter defluvii]|uniref:T9SS type A sorting domain-containing protein n=1 Tax=Hymenobacter defluvii TaxID=2054411 RepID=A0ABS3TI49_9BACT|nr:Ig-like domain-containing protein [Hymenobacter defluvii]MBO3273336.1 T9SS type A sorting domain-containing protein [Hymenobacter defluvii]
MKQPYSITSYQLICSVLLLLGSWLGLTTSSQAQVFYLTTDANGSATTATDALNRMEYDGTNAMVIAPAVTASPFLLAVDVPTNRAFVYESVLANRAIKVINLTTGALIRSISGIQAGIRALRYDPASDYIYYLTSADVPATIEPTDALNRVHPDGTGAEVLVASLSTSPLYLALNTAANEVYFYEGLNTARAIKTVNLASRTVTQTTPVSALVQAIEYDVATGFLYYLTSDNSIATTTSIDALNRFRPDGTSPSVIVPAVTASPFLLALDAATNRAFVYESTATNRAIKTVNLLTGSVTQTAPVAAQVTGLSVPVTSALVAPTIVTSAANDISSTAATLGGNVTADGGANVIDRGVVYSSTATTPTTSNTKVTIGSGTGSFSQKVSGLTSGTTYYVRSYAINSMGTGYGAVQSFTTAAALTASPSSQTNLACNGGNTGMATVRVSGGTSPYSYSWRNNTTSSPLTQTTATVTGLTAGNYTVTVTDASGATATSTFTLTEPSALATTGSQVNVSTAGGNNGTATVNMSGGTSPYSYSWRNNTTSSPLTQTTATVTGLTAGNYTVTVTDASGCTTSRAYTITQPAAAVTATSLVRATASPTNTTAVAFALTFSSTVSGLSSSNFSITTSGLTGASITSISGSGTTYTVRVNTGSGDGTLRLNLANATGLSPTVSNVPFVGETYTIDKTAPAAPVVTTPANGSLLATNTPTYNGTAEAGSMVMGVIDGTPLEATTQVTSGGSWQLPAPSALADGTHTVVTRTTDASGNTSVNSNTNTFTIDTSAPTVAISSSAGPSGGSTATSPIPFTVTFSESVTGFAAGDVTVNNGTLSGYSGGSGTTYTFSVTPASTGAVTVSVAANVAQDGAGNGSTAAAPFTIQYAPLTAPTVTTTTASSITATAATLGGNVTADGGGTVTERGVVYVVGNGTPTTASTKVQSGNGIGSFSQRITGLTAGSLYTVRAYATNASGTSYGTSVTFTTSDALGYFGVQRNVSCNGGADGTASVNVTGGVTPYSYDWTPGTLTGNGTNTVSGLTAGNYSVTVTDASGFTIMRSFTITQPTALTATSTQTNVTMNGGNNGAATITVSGGTPAYTYSWSPNVSTTATASNLSAGTYTVTATDANGCTIVRSFTITQPAPTTAAPVVTAPANGSLLNTAAPRYAGTASPNSTVTVYVDATNIGTTTATSSGTFELIQPTSLAEGSHTVYATAQEGNGTVSATSNTNTFTVDTTAPTVAISSAAGSSGSSTSTSPLPFTVTFSESVTGFTAGRTSVTGGTLSGFSGSGTTYSFTVTPPTTGGEVTVTVAANVAQDAAGNGNVAATAFSLRYVLPVTATTWTGGVSTDWFTGGNWTAGVPTSTLDAQIPAVSSGRYPLIASGLATARALTLNSTAQLTQNGGTLTLTGDFVNNGTFTASSGQMVLASNALQNVGGSSPTRFFHLTVGAAGARLSGPAELQRVLTLNGDLTTNAQPFTLLSTATATALVVNNAGRVLGTATVQRAIDSSLNPGAGYRHYSSPVASTTVSDLATSGFTPVVNPAYNTVGTTVQPFPTVYGYDEARLTGSSSSTTQAFEYGYFSPGSLSDPLVRGRGYTVNLNASNTVDLVGTLNTGSIPVGALSSSTEANAGWHLLGNPYPAPLDWSKARLSLPAGVIDAVYVYKSSDQYRGTYQFYQNGFGTLPDGLIGSMQGFFVRVSQPVAAFNFLDAWRSTTDQSTTFHRPAAEKRTAVQMDLVSAAGMHEPTFVYFEAGATADLDDHYDAAKLPNTTGLNLSSLAEEARLAVNGLPLLTTPTAVPLAVGVPLTGTYTLHAAALQNVDATDVYLHDAVTGQQVNLKQQPSYTFTASNASLITDRFFLRFSPLRPLATQPGSQVASLSVYPNPTRQQVTLQVPAVAGASTATATLYTMLGQPVRATTLPLSAVGGRTTLDVHELPTGMYVVRVQVGGTTLTKQLLID